MPRGAQYDKGLTAGKTQVEERYNDGHIEGYNEGYDAGLTGEPFDYSDNDASTDVQGDSAARSR